MASQLSIICTKCNEPKGTTKVRYDKLAKEGKIENYVCKSCKGKTKVKNTSNKGQTIECTKCGQHKATTPVRYQRLLEEGRIENYICRDCKPKVTKPSKKNIKKHNKFDTTIEPTLGLSDWMKSYVPSRTLRPPLTKEDYFTINTCFRPDIWAENKKRNNNEGACNGCPMIEYCGCLTKSWSKRIEKKESLDRPKKK